MKLDEQWLMKCSANIRYFDQEKWPEMVAYFIQSQIILILQNQRQCNVMLTGGRSAARLYEAWGGLAEFRQLNKVYFYFGDERCVAPDHTESNYGLVMRTLFKLGVPPDCKVVRMAAEQADREAAAATYEAQLPGRLDLLILSVGDDGHIASIFPHSAVLQEAKRRVVPVIAPKPPRDRLTVTPLVITQADRIFIMAIGPTKAEVYRKTLVEPQDIETLPARLALNATWILDTDLNN